MMLIVILIFMILIIISRITALGVLTNLIKIKEHSVLVIIDFLKVNNN